MNSEHKKDLVSGFANLQEVAITERPAPRSAAPNGRGWPQHSTGAAIDSYRKRRLN